MRGILNNTQKLFRLERNLYKGLVLSTVSSNQTNNEYNTDSEIFYETNQEVLDNVLINFEKISFFLVTFLVRIVYKNNCVYS